MIQEPQEMQVWSLGWEDPLEEGMATHSSILAWGILWTEEPGGLQSMVTKIWTRVTQLSRHILIITQWIGAIIIPILQMLSLSHRWLQKKKKTCPWSNRKRIVGTLFEPKMSSFRVCAFDHYTVFQSQTTWNVYLVKVSRISALAFIVRAGRKGMLSKK